MRSYDMLHMSTTACSIPGFRTSRTLPGQVGKQTYNTFGHLARTCQSDAVVQDLRRPTRTIMTVDSYILRLQQGI